ncbi:hypothetical protein [Geomicrobium sp. JCM 19055]|uniref:hypothetical protein n=1 Tax=Geomicrobium sp. JCM 19055 TaxID=1460649 RepID=UPI00045ED271|nr:hypothetical protein [Geomicrobium sp. JCM 19055]GAK00897.1 hypothetical protein JCM19055_4020 [Geomicrobium sp. JCM 19055]
MEKNGVDLKKVREWVNQSKDKYDVRDYWLVFRQLATYEKSINDTKAFIYSTVKMLNKLWEKYLDETRDSMMKQRSENVSPMIEKPDYNWLES